MDQTEDEAGVEAEHEEGTDRIRAIDCGTCRMRDTEACDDCLVTAVLSRPPGPFLLDDDEQRAVAQLQRAGLLPVVRYRPAS